MSPDFFDALLSPAHWGAVCLTLAVVATVVGVHFEALSALNRRLPHLRIGARFRVVALIFAVLAVHCTEIWLFGAAAWIAVPALGHVSGAEPLKLLDAIYLSTITYTTVGYGDLVPHGPLRFLLGVEGLAGLVLITWSASFTYLEMQRDWRERRG